MTELANTVPAWVIVVVMLFLLCGGVLALIGAFALLSLKDFYQRIHGPAITVTFGAGAILIASMLYFSVLQSRPVIHELLITLFVMLSAPLTSMLLMRAAVYREKRNEKKREGSSD